MNYRHIFHAGNFADLVKHAILGAVLARLMADWTPLDVIDTHAGAGLYDLGADEALTSGEAKAGVDRLMADAAAPAVFGALTKVIKKLNQESHLRRYPGSPFLIADVLRKGDALTACELRADDFATLRRVLGRPGVEVLQEDGYKIAAERARPGRRTLVLIDPPFERADETAAILACVRALLRRNPVATIVIWLPLKDLETFDGFLRGLEAMSPPPTLVAEARLRPLHDPTRMNGCALVIINDPPGTEQMAELACRWVAETLGEPGGLGRVWRL